MRLLFKIQSTMNILKIIKKAPKDHVYYCLMNGDCHVEITNDEKYPITVRDISDTGSIGLTEEGKYFADSEIPGGDYILFPSRDNRDWEAFERELGGDVSGKSFFDNTFDGTAEMVSIPDRPMMAAVIMSGMLAGGCKDKGAALVNKALHLADLILDRIKEDCK